LTASQAAPELDLRAQNVSQSNLPALYVLFFLSGFPALLYQIVWQRALFTIYGVNVESVTVVVTAFMLGLGFGSLFGGLLSRSSRLSLLALFGAIELGIAAYGFFSLRIFHWLGSETAGGSALHTGAFAFLLVLLPTMLMGSTLPLLVTYSVRQNSNVGASVSVLYAVNTFGSALACFCAAAFIMRSLGESGSVRLAAALNAAIGISVVAWQMIGKSRTTPLAHEQLPTEVHSRRTLSLPIAMVASGLAGFVALGYEIVWYRVFAFASQTVASTFAYLLGAYLGGIAIGSLATERLFKSSPDVKRLAVRICYCALVATLFAFVVAPGLAFTVRYVNFSYAYTLVCVAAAFLGAVFPMLCHAAVQDNVHAGRGMSLIYVANIVGSALGSYLIGYVLLDMFRIPQICAILAIFGVLLTLLLALASRSGGIGFLKPAIAGLAVTLFVTFAANPLYHALYEKLQLRTAYLPGMRFHSVVENRSGVITMTEGGMVFGGGVYDGAFNIDPVNDTNGIFRAYATAFLKPQANRVLVIGLSTGSWAQVVVNNPAVESMTIVEINPGYLQMIVKRPEVASLLSNPKVNIVIDDGRRWLVRNPGRKFDLVVSNTTFHWRAHASSLLSVEFLELVRAHLNPGGVHYYNTTNSARAFATGLSSFKYGLRVGNFLAVSDSPFRTDAGSYRETLKRYGVDGRAVFNLSEPQHQQRLEEMVSILDPSKAGEDIWHSITSGAAMRETLQSEALITDDNMGSEWSPPSER
jgi:spermidine synthase